MIRPLPLLLLTAAAVSAAADGVLPDREAVRKTSEKPTIRSTIGPIMTPIAIELSHFLLDHPDLSAYICRTHGIAPYRIVMTSPNSSRATDGAGTTGEITMIDKAPDRRVYYGDGTHRAKPFPAIAATAVIVLDLSAPEKPGCGRLTRSSFDVRLRLKNPALAVVVKTLRAFLRETIMKKFSRALLSAHKVGELIARDPESVRKDFREFEGLTAEERARGLSLLSKSPPLDAACFH